MAIEDTLSVITGEIGKAFWPLEDALDSLESFEGFMYQLGWDVDVIPQPIANLSGAISSVVSEVDKILDGTVTVSDISNLASALNTLTSAISGLGSQSFSMFPADFPSVFPRQLIDYLIFKLLEEHHPKVFAILQLAGLLRRDWRTQTATRPSYIHLSVAWQDLGAFFTNPTVLFQNAYQWGQSDFDYEKLISHLLDFLVIFGVPAFLEEMRPNVVTALELSAANANHVKYKLVIPFLEYDNQGTSAELGAGLFYLPESGNLLPGMAILPYGEGTFSQDFSINDVLTVKVDAGMNFTGGLALVVRPGQGFDFQTGFDADPPAPTAYSGSLDVQVINADQDGDPIVLFGSAAGSRVEYQRFSTGVGMTLESHGDQELVFEVAVEGGKVVIQLDGADGFLQSVLPGGGIESDFDVRIGFSTLHGFYFMGSMGLTIIFPTHLQLGPVLIDDLRLGLGISSGSGGLLNVNAGASIGVDLGPFKALVENMGVKADFDFPGSGGNLGPVDLKLGFKPPNGMGLSLDTGAIRGGGYLYFDYDEQRYAGVAELTIQELVSVKAIGLLATRLPGGQDGFSLLLMITAEFTPIQLGFGFTLNGVGGLIGVNRTIVAEALQRSVRTGSLDHLLFPKDPVGQARQIISELRSVFPPAENRYVFGLMGYFGWGVPTLIKIKMGLIIEVPNPVKFGILGVVSVILPDENFKLLSLNVSFLGFIDFGKGCLSFDASLFDSRLLFLTLEGDMALRIGWKADSHFVLSVGGFHPAYQPPAGLAGMRRITVNLLGDPNARITITNYFAVTSNSVQFGARSELFFKAGKISVRGHMGWDVLFQFNPFYFIISASASIGLYWGSKMLIGMSIGGQLEGPTPWRFRGYVRFKILFFTIKFRINVKWGDDANSSLPDIAVYPLLQAALAKKENWRATLPGRKAMYVQLRELDTADALVHPLGILAVSQTEVPLNVEVEKFGNQKASDAGVFKIVESRIQNGPVMGTSPVKEEFAPANFRVLTESEKVSSPDFVRFESGVSMSGTQAFDAKYFVKREIRYESSILNGGVKKSIAARTVDTAFFEAHVLSGRAGSSPVSFSPVQKSALAPDSVIVEEEQYGVVRTSDLRLYDSVSMKGSFYEAVDYLREIVSGSPAMESEVMVLPGFEIVA